MTLLRGTVISVVSAVLALSAAGCGAGDSGSGAPSDGGVAQSETAPSPAATATPDAKKPWEEKSYAGAEAFTRHWFDVFSQAMPTGDTTEMRAISDPGCVNCAIVIEQLEGYYEAGGFFRSKGWEVTKATSLKSRPIAEPLVGLTIVTHPERFKESADAKVVRNDASEGAFSAELRWTAGHWLMTKFEPEG